MYKKYKITRNETTNHSSYKVAPERRFCENTEEWNSEKMMESILKNSFKA